MPPQQSQSKPAGKSANALLRAKMWYVILLVICAIFLVRLFYLQVIRHEYYRTTALQGQFKEYEIPPERGIIEAHNGNQVIPIVLNEAKYTLFADPKFIENSADASTQVQKIVGGDVSEYEKLMKLDTRYAILKKKLTKAQSEDIEKLELKGIGTRKASYRTYPQGSLAAQVLGFVNDEGQGTYGIEQYFDDRLKGKPGELKAITDARGVPLVANDDNVVKNPEQGQRVVLTIDVSMQKYLEDLLKKGLDRARSKTGSALIMDPETGAIKAMANFPTYNPSEFAEVKDARAFNNATVSEPLEVGSVMKPLTLAAALDQGAVTKNSSYADPGRFEVDDAIITNVAEAGGPGHKTVRDILEQSLNTGATWLLMQMGGGKINETARVKWHTYMTDHYRFGKKTGIEQSQEVSSSVPDPKDGYGLNIKFANTAFGQGISNTPLQMGAALSSVVNGGTYYRPRLIDKTIDHDGTETIIKPEVLKQNVVKPETSKTITEFMQGVVRRNYLVYGMKQVRPQYKIGGKTGTAQIANPAGGYYDDKFNGTFTGFIGGDKIQYVIVIRVNEPGIAGYAGSKAAGPIFADVSEMLINNFNVLPKSR